MPRNIVVVGPPGTGKTESQITTAQGWFQAGAAPEEVAYLAFTKAAAREASSRIKDEELGLNLPTGKLPFFRTLHSLAYRGLSQERKDLQLMTPGDMKLFANWSGFEGAYTVGNSEDLAEVYQRLEGGGRTDWDKCLTAYTMSRISARTPEELELAKTRTSRLATRTLGWLEESTYQVFVKKYEAYKIANGRVDFTDMLEHALCEMETLDGVRFVVIDESQDLAPILYAIVDRLFANAEEIWWAGDPNQAIYGFAAADAKLFIDRAQKADYRLVLRQTHRFGQKVVDFSTKIIKRARDRIVVDVMGVEGRRHEITRTGSFTPVVEPMLIVHRHVMGCQALAAAYIAAGKPFRNERGKDPLGSDVRVRAFQALHDLAGGKQVASGGVMRLIEDLMPSMILDETTGQRKRFVVHGAKKKLNEGIIKGDVTLRDLGDAKILTSEGMDLVRGREGGKNFRAFKYADDLEYYQRVVENGYSLEATEVPIITTIHGSKGRQAPRVVIFSEYGQKCKEDMDNEHRLAYVASTRTRGGLEVCAERTVDWAEERYQYPVEEPMKAEDIDFDE